MEASNIIALILGGIGFVISIISIIISPALNLKSRRLEKRLEYRFQLFQKILQLWESTHKFTLEDNEFKVLLLEVNKLMQLYGYNSEIKLFNNVVEDYNNLAKNDTEDNKKRLISTFNTFFSYSFNEYRKEIVLDKLEG